MISLSMRTTKGLPLLGDFVLRWSDSQSTTCGCTACLSFIDIGLMKH